MRELVKTGFKLRYQDSVLGYLWSLLKPIFLFTVLYIVLVGFLGIGAGDPTWPVSLLLGIVLWNFFSEITGTGLSSIVDRGDMIRKVNFPKYVIILSNSFLALINLALNFVVIAIFMVVNHIELTWSAAFLPIYILELFVFALGLAFLLSALFVKLRDINYIWEIIMQALFYGSVVMFPLAIVISRSQQFAEILLLNPIASIIQGARHVVVNPDSNPTLYTLTGNIWLELIPIVIVVATFVIGALYFKRRSPRFAEEI
ncbi:MAG: ABC transporter permease [Candidatus Microsaccharimonas sp.]